MTELVGYPGSRFLLMQREFRVAMQVHVERFDLRVDAIDLVFGRRTPGISGKQWVSWRPRVGIKARSTQGGIIGPRDGKLCL